MREELKRKKKPNKNKKHMNKKTKKIKKDKIFQVSYISQTESFLKSWEDLRLEYCEKPLDEFISSDLTQMNGILFHKYQITSVGFLIYSSLKTQEPEKPKNRIQDSKIFLIVYTQCQIDDVVLFFVWHFETQVVTESREA